MGTGFARANRIRAPSPHSESANSASMAASSASRLSTTSVASCKMLCHSRHVRKDVSISLPTVRYSCASGYVLCSIRRVLTV